MISHWGRIKATSDEQAAMLIWDRFPDAIEVRIMTLVIPVGVFQWYAILHDGGE